MQQLQLRSARSNHGDAVETPGRAGSRGRVAHDGEIPLFVRRQPAASDSPLLLRKSCGADCECATRRAQGTHLSQPGDSLEREADAMADRVMRSAQPARAPAEHDATAAAAGGLAPSGGRKLDAVTRAWMEPRFGTRLDTVLVHDDPEAGRRANALVARAYAVGEHLVFGPGEYRPGTDAGRRLIAHELAHVIQQRRGIGENAALRTVDASKLSCPANKAGAGADPAADLADLDQRAQGLSEAMSILAIGASVLNPAQDSHSFSVSYRTRMGRPQRVGKQFRDRFTGQLHSTEEEAAREEVSEIADRFIQVNDFLSGPITYKCRANGVEYTLGACTGRCTSSLLAEVCVPNDRRTIGICRAFWGLDTDAERAGTLVHEAAHAQLNFSGHGHGSRAQRGRNPACYESMVADVFGFPPDAKCPSI
jgi:hypothetical protein